MSVSVTISQVLTAVETLDGNADPISAAKRKVTWDALSSKQTSLNADTTVPATKIAGGKVALVAGSKTLDLTALTGLGANGQSVDMTGLKVQAIYAENPGTNLNSISIAVGGTNGYNFSGADGKLTLEPGQSVVLFGNDKAPDVAVGAKTLDLAGTLTQALNLVIVAG